MPPRPAQQIRPQQLRMLPPPGTGILPDRGSMVVEHAEVLQDRDRPAGVANLQTEIQVLTIEAEAFVQRSGFFPGPAAQSQGGPGDPVDPAGSGPDGLDAAPSGEPRQPGTGGARPPGPAQPARGRARR